MECRLDRTLDRRNEEREGSRMITWLLTGTDKEIVVLLTERSERGRMPAGVEFVKFEMPVGDPKKNNW